MKKTSMMKPAMAKGGKLVMAKGGKPAMTKGDKPAMAKGDKPAGKMSKSDRFAAMLKGLKKGK